MLCIDLLIDTIGYTLSDEFFFLFKYIIAKFPFNELYSHHPWITNNKRSKLIETPLFICYMSVKHINTLNTLGVQNLLK